MSVGFQYGPARVVRLCRDDKLGVWIEVSGAREFVEIRVTPGGRLRVGKPIRYTSGQPSRTERLEVIE